MKTILTKLINHQTLSREEARDALRRLSSSDVNGSQVVAFMTTYMMRQITVDELMGFREAMLSLCTPVHIEQPAMDMCGTGGDGKNTFNISTLASLVVAAAGQPVVKHGNYGVSSVCGSSNVLEYFGCRFTNDEAVVKKSLEATNFCMLHAPLFHSAMKHVAPYRKELGVKTFFNMLGPLVNPAKPSIQLTGVFNLELARMYAYILQASAKQFSIIHSLDGYDEITLTSSVKCYTESGETLLELSRWREEKIKPEQISGGETIEESAAIFKQVLDGQGTKEQHDVVIANAAVALHTAKKVTLEEATQTCREALLSGKARDTFKKFLTIYS